MNIMLVYIEPGELAQGLKEFALHTADTGSIPGTVYDPQSNPRNGPSRAGSKPGALPW